MCCEDLFEVTACYFPVDFTPVSPLLSICTYVHTTYIVFITGLNETNIHTMYACMYALFRFYCCFFCFAAMQNGLPINCAGFFLSYGLLAAGFFVSVAIVLRLWVFHMPYMKQASVSYMVISTHNASRCMSHSSSTSSIMLSGFFWE